MYLRDELMWDVWYFLLQEIFEQVNKAYEFLCSRAKITEGPNPQNIVLILKAQSILFRRYKDGECIFMLWLKGISRYLGILFGVFSIVFECIFYSCVRHLCILYTYLKNALFKECKCHPVLFIMRQDLE